MYNTGTAQTRGRQRKREKQDAAAPSFLWTNAGKPRRRRRWTRRCQDQDGDPCKVRKHVLAEQLKRLIVLVFLRVFTG